MAKMNYLNFDLLIERSGEQYRTRVLNSATGQAVSDFGVPFSKQELEEFLSKGERPPKEAHGADLSRSEVIKSFGTRLFEAVFVGDVLGCLRSSLKKAKQQDNTGLRLRLGLEKTPELADLPWEYLYDPSLTRAFSLSIETPIVRYLEMPETVLPLAVKPPLRALVMISNPTDQPQIDVEQEWVKLKEAVSELERKGLLVLERLEKATVPVLQKRFREDEYHIFHFIGHGDFDMQTKACVLIMEDDKKLGRPVTGSYLGTVLCDEHTLRLAFLNVRQETHIPQSGHCTSVSFLKSSRKQP